MTGTVKKVFLEDGYGFISPGPNQADIFFHASALTDRGAFSTLQKGQTVVYDLQHHEKGLRAINVALPVSTPTKA